MSFPRTVCAGMRSGMLGTDLRYADFGHATAVRVKGLLPDCVNFRNSRPSDVSGYRLERYFDLHLPAQ